jgi:GTP-binding protein HflX
LGCAEKPQLLVFNKIDAYTWVEKEADDLTPRTKENIPLDELMQTWMAKMGKDAFFISAREKTNIDAFRQLLYNNVRELHVQKYPYNDFLYSNYDNEGNIS